MSSVLRLSAFLMTGFVLVCQCAFGQLDDMLVYQSQQVAVYARDLELIESPYGSLVSFTLTAEGQGDFLPGSFDGIMRDGQVNSACGIVCEPFHGDQYNSHFLYDASLAITLQHSLIAGYEENPNALTGVFSLFSGQQVWEIAQVYSTAGVNIELGFTLGQPGSDKTEFVQANFTPLLGGDANLDGHVNINDFLILKSNYGSCENCTWQAGDFDGNNKIDISDFLILKSSYEFGGE